MRCVGMWGAKSVFSVGGGRYRSSTAPTNACCSIISTILTPLPTQSAHLQVDLVGLNLDYHGTGSCKAPLLLLNIRYARSMVCVWDDAGDDDATLGILTKIRYLLDTFRVLFSVLTSPDLVDSASGWAFAASIW